MSQHCSGAFSRISKSGRDAPPRMFVAPRDISLPFFLLCARPQNAFASLDPARRSLLSAFRLYRMRRACRDR